MQKYSILKGFIEKQKQTVIKFVDDVLKLDLNIYENQYVFALKTQQLYTAVEDILERIAKTFENSIQDFQKYHSELLRRMTIEVSNHRPAVIHDSTFIFLNKIRAFRHFIRHAYDYELDKEELTLLQNKIKTNSPNLINDLELFVVFLDDLLNE